MREAIDLRRARDRVVVGSLVLVPFAIAAIYIAKGVGYVLDDWWLLGNADVGGAWNAAGHHAYPRPGGWLLWAFQFGVVGAHPAVSVLILAALNATAAVLLHSLLRRMLPASLAIGTAVLWVVLPAHTSLEVWHSCSIVSASLALAAASALLAGSGDTVPNSRLLVAAFCAAAAIVTYEASAPVVLAAAVATPWAIAGRHRVRTSAWLLAGGLAGSAWSLINRPDVKSLADENSNISQVVPANFGWGVLPDGVAADVGMLIVVVFLLVAIASPWLSTVRLDRETAVVASASVALLGLGAAVFIRYPYGPLGAGDRANYVSAIGGSLALMLVARSLWRWQRAVAGVVCAAFLVASMAVRWERTQLWSAAGDDSHRVLAALEQLERRPDRIVFGPRPFQFANIASFLDDSNVNGLVQVALDDEDTVGALSYTDAQFEAAPPGERFDVRPYLELDDVADDLGVEPDS